MYRIISLIFSFSIFFHSVSSMSEDRWPSFSGIARQPNLTEDVSEERNETTSFENLPENSTTQATESDVLFWTKPETNENKEENIILQVNNQETVLEESSTQDKTGALGSTEKEEANNQTNVSLETQAAQVETTNVNEKMVLQRLNCNLEMVVEDTHGLKIQIKFSQLQNYTSGTCCITLNGPEDSLLAVLISGIHLYQNSSDGELLQVIVLNRGLAFVLREYHHWSQYEPLLLTEAHRVFLVLHYKVTTIPPNEQESHFDLEVLTYHKYENQIPPNIVRYSPAFSPVKVQNYRKLDG